MTKYFNKEGKEITENLFLDLSKDASYIQAFAFQNHKVRLVIAWTGAIENAENLFRNSYPLFTAYQQDYLPDEDRWIESPESGQTFSSINKASGYYQAFLLDWTSSYFDEDGEIVEVDNELAPPPPPPEPPPPGAPTGAYEVDVW